MNELWYPPDFMDWPAEQRGAWYSVNATRKQILRLFREAAGADQPGKSDKLNKATLAAAARQVLDEDEVVVAPTSRMACIKALCEVAGLDPEREEAQLTTQEKGAVLDLLRDNHPTSPSPVGESWGGNIRG